MYISCAPAAGRATIDGPPGPARGALAGGARSVRLREWSSEDGGYTTPPQG
jgi:hypothetical protein